MTTGNVTWAVSSSRRATQAIVHLERLASNVRRICAHLEPGVGLLAVIKADGYGHGAVAVARTALLNGATWLGVACVDEGITLRNAGIEAPILVMGYAAPEELHLAVQSRLTLTLGTVAQTEALIQAARRSSARTEVHLKIDTGMGRFGILPHQLDQVARALRATPEIELSGCFTHLARGEEHTELATSGQVDVFRSAVRLLRRHGLEPRLLHAANSGATLTAPHAHFDLVRCGLLLYGYRSDGGSRDEIGIEPVMEVRSTLVRVEALPQGTAIGYGHTHRLHRNARIGLVPMGYADGLQRSLSDVGSLLVCGSRVPIVGRISMDQCMVDVTDTPDAREGDPVTVIGACDHTSVWADDLATWAGTITYEILCGISPRVPRHYIERHN